MDCRRLSSRSSRFCTSLPPDTIILKQTLTIELTKVAGKPVLELVYTHTHFGNAVWIRPMPTADFWLAFLECWSAVYAKHPSKIWSDLESGVNSETFQDLEMASENSLQLSHVKAHKRIIFGEKYDGPLRKIYKMLQDAYLTLDKQRMSRLALESMNDYICLQPLLHSLLVLGAILFSFMTSMTLLKRKESMAALV